MTTKRKGVSWGEPAARKSGARGLSSKKTVTGGGKKVSRTEAAKSKLRGSFAPTLQKYVQKSIGPKLGKDDKK